MVATNEAVGGRPPHLEHDQLLQAQAETLAAARRRYGVLARILFVTLDTLYGKQRTISKFKVLELVARVPYQSWEQIAYIAITHVHNRTKLARRIYDQVRHSREQQDNEQWHLLILEELIAKSGNRENDFYYFWIPQAIAMVYYQISWLLFVIKPKWSYLLNADFEDHAEHEYMLLVGEHPEWEDIPFRSDFAADYGSFGSLADLFRQIGHGERGSQGRIHRTSCQSPLQLSHIATTNGYAPIWQGQLHHAVPSVPQRRGEREPDEEGDG